MMTIQSRIEEDSPLFKTDIINLPLKSVYN